MKKEKRYWDKKIELLPIEDLKKFQLKRLRYTVSYVYSHNKFYKEKLKAANVSPSDVKTSEDIKKIPFITKDELRNYYPFSLVCKPITALVGLHASSGTTGKPVVAVYTKRI